jgi:cation-transporting P-type ATPase E
VAQGTPCVTEVGELRHAGGVTTSGAGPDTTDHTGSGSASPSPSGVPAGLVGLSTAEAERRRAEGQGNAQPPSTSRTTGQIIRANLFTRFNAILASLWAVILIIGPFQDSLFGILIVSNTGIGVIQELRARRTLDRLAIVAAPAVTVLRDGAGLVMGDLFEVRTGEQVPVDGTVRWASGLEVDESLLTGESDAETKQAGTEVLSGSVAVAGFGWVEAAAVGDEAYASKLAAEAKRFSLLGSELRTGIDRILRWITWILPPTAVILTVSQLVANDDKHMVRTALRGAVAGVVNMVPEGLVLLTSVAFAVGVVRLAGARVLAQELAAIEGLARVDVVCVDKTGTLTLGRIHLAALDDLTADQSAGLTVAMLLRADPAPNASAKAILEGLPVPFGDQPAPGDETSVVTQVVAFSSERKWSGAAFEGRGAYLLGGADVLLAAPMAATPEAAAAREAAVAAVDAHLVHGRRVLLLASAPEAALADLRPAGVHPLAVIALEEELRPDAADTVRYFLDQGVTLKVISGDDSRTVGGVASRVGVPGADSPVDARTLPSDDDELAEVMATRSVFGRVTPHQKRAMVKALQARGHTVAMTGDGVNDVLALKDADMGVAMGSGSAASRSVARLVLLDDSWASLPFCVAEGRRVIANVERVANLFVTKTVYATVLALAIAAFGVDFPFLPRHLTVVSGLTIGIPAFFLALSPATGPARTGFARRVMGFAGPAGAVVAAVVLAAYGVARANIDTSTDAGLHEAQTVALIALFGVAMGVLVLLSRPYTGLRVLLVGAMPVAFGAILATPAFRDFLAIELPTANMATVALGLVAVGLVVLVGVDRWRVAPAD